MDKTTIIPSDTLVIMGDGFWSNEAISFQETHYYADTSVGTPTELRALSTDSHGSFSTVWSFTGGTSVPVAVEIRATGHVSHLTASAIVTITNTVLEITSAFPDTVCVDTFTSGSTINVCARLVQLCGGGVEAPLAGRTILFFVNQGNCGVNEGQSPHDSTITDENGEACLTIDGLDTLLVADDRISFRLKFLGESAPSEEEPPNSACDPDNRINLSISNDCKSVRVVTDCAEEQVDYQIIAGDSADVFYVTTVDIDRDNHTDVIYTGNSVEGLFIAFGVSGDSLEYPAGYLPINQAAIDADYVDGDTLLDIVAVDASNVYVLLNNGDRTFTVDSIPLGNATIVTKPNSGEDTESNQTVTAPSLVTGYFNADSYVDVVIAPDQLWFGDVLADFSTRDTLPFSFETVNSCDFSNDGYDDLLVSTSDSAKIYLNDGSGTFSPGRAVFIGSPLFVISPVNTVTDFNNDGNCDFALVIPLADSSGESMITIGLGDGTGDLLQYDTIRVMGIAHSLTVADINHDNALELIIANGTTQQLEIYFGDGLGGFGVPVTIDLLSGGITFALASLDVDRDGNFDFVSGALDGDNLLLAVDQQPDDPVIIDEMVTTAFTDATVKVINPNGFVISENLRTVAGSDFQTLDVDNNGTLDDRTLDYNLQYGEYTIIIGVEAGAANRAAFLSADIRINGSQEATIFLDYNAELKSGAGFAVDSLVFYYTVEETSSIQPPNGIPTDRSRPTFDWSLLVVSQPLAVSHHFQLDRFYDFRNPIFDSDTLLSPLLEAPSSLGNDSVFYWRFRTFDGASWSDYSRTFAVYITGVCCFGSTGNVNGDIQGDVDMSDITYLVSYLFKQGPFPPCPDAGNADGDPVGSINIVDVTYLVGFLFRSGPPSPPCP